MNKKSSKHALKKTVDVASNQKVTPAMKMENKTTGKKPLPATVIIKPKPVSLTKDEPVPKGLYSLEYVINSSPDVLFEFISTPGGLENWFADRVYIIEGNFVFKWDDGEKKLAKLIEVRDNELARFHWLDESPKRYFEFRIQIDDLTGEVALIVSDFADNRKEQEESTLLWNSQIHDLYHAIGSV